MKKPIFCIFILLTLFFCIGCTDTIRKRAEDPVNAPVTVTDDRTSPATASREKTKPIPTAAGTGLPLLAPRTYSPRDPQNTAGRSTERKEHSFGVSDGKTPHPISVEAQQYFRNGHFQAICYDDAAKEKAIYLTFDCGWENGCTNQILDTLKETQTPAAFFCTLDHIRSSPALIARMIREGHIVGNHSASHPDFSTLTQTQMAKEILDCENELREKFGYAMKYFRFPMGAYNENALSLVGEMGYTAVFWSAAYADWDVEACKGADYAYEAVTSRLHPGAILLLHSVSPDNAQALKRIIAFAREQGYIFRPLTAYGS